MPETHTAMDLRSATPTKQLVLERTIKASPELSAVRQKRPPVVRSKAAT
jgi:hypothetical protein